MSFYYPPIDPLAGGSLGIGATGLNGIPQLPGVGTLPYAGPFGSAGVPGLPNIGAQAFTRLGPVNGLAGQVPVGVGQEAASAASALRPFANAGSSGGSLASRAAGLIPRVATANPNATGLARYLAPGVTGRAALGRAGLGGAAGMLGSNLIDTLDIGGQNSNLEQGLQGFAQGAGLGAGIGSVVPGLGTGLGVAIGGIGGGAIGVLSNIFGGGGDDGEAADPVTVLATAIQQAGLTPDYTEAVLQTYETQMALAEGLEGDAREAAEANAYNTASQMILQYMAQQQQAQQQAPIDAANTLAMQQQAQQIFQPLADDIRTSSNLYAQAMSGIRDQLPESYRAVSDATVARELTSADRLANAYQAQAALTPVVQQLTRYQQDQDAFAQQMFSQALAQQAAAMNAGGYGSAGAVNSDLLSQLVPT